MKKSQFRILQLVGVAACALTIGAPSFANEEVQAQDDSTSGDIIVTARKREETLLDVPVAVSALSSETLTRYNANDLNAISTMVPNVTIVKAASGTGASMTIRGVGSTFNDFGIDQTVSINVDGIQISRGFITNVAFFDVEQVEVLKGPQALFFGKNSPGGVVSVRSKGATKQFQAGIKAGYEFVADERYVEGFVSGPVSDTLGARLAVRYSKMDGWLHNNATDGANPSDTSFPLRRAGDKRAVSSENLTGRLTLDWNPTDAFRAELKVLGNKYEDNGMGNIAQPVRCAPGNVRPGDSATIIDPTGDCRADNQISSGGLPVGIEKGYLGGDKRNGKLWSTVDSYLTTLRLSYDMEKVKFDSVTGYSYGDFKTLSNYGYTSFTRYPGYVTELSKLFTQELRFNTDLGGAFNFAGGVYYESSNRRGNIATRFPLSLTPSTDVGYVGATYQTYRLHTIKGDAWSAFGQAMWDIVDNVELSGGVRYTKEKKTTSQVNLFVDSRVPASFNIKPMGQYITNKFDDSNWSPEVTLSYKPTPNLNIYGAYKTGYKSGGASIPTTITNVLTNESVGFGPEKSKGGEIGVKGKLFDNSMTFTAVAYSYKLQGLQLVMPETTPQGIFVNYVRNAADAKTQGFEFDADFRVSNELALQAGLSYNDAKITRFPNAPCWAGQAVSTSAQTGCLKIVSPIDPTKSTSITDRAGDPLSKAPEWVLTGGFTYEREIGNDLLIGLSSQFKYSSKYRTQDDGAPYAFQPSYTTVDATVSIGSVNKNWELAVIGRNLTNEYYLQVTSPRPGGQAGELHGVIARPREVAVQASYKF